MPRGEPLDIAFIDIDPIAREGDIPARAPAPRSRGWWRCLQGWRWLRCRRWVRASDWFCRFFENFGTFERWSFGFLGLFGWFHEDGEFEILRVLGKGMKKWLKWFELDRQKAFVGDKDIYVCNQNYYVIMSILKQHGGNPDKTLPRETTQIHLSKEQKSVGTSATPLPCLCCQVMFERSAFPPGTTSSDLTWWHPCKSMYIDLSKAWNSATVCHLSSLWASKSCCKCRIPIGWNENKPGGVIGPIQQICKVWFEALETSKISQLMTYNKSVPLTALCFKTQRDLLQQWWDA